MKTPFFSVFMPVYNGGQTIYETIDSILKQSFSDFELIIRDNGSTDNTLAEISKFKDNRIIVKKNSTNLGYPGNLNKLFLDCHSNNVFIMAADDLLDINALKWYYQVLQNNPKVGAITRPYYWFLEDYQSPIRIKSTTKNNQNLTIRINDDFNKVLFALSAIDQVSGLFIKKNLTKVPFDSELWISHGYPWLDIFKNHPVAFLGKYPLAVRLGSSATRTNIYQKSPMISWKNLIDTIFFEKKYKKIKDKIIKDFIATNYIGLVQIKNYGSFQSYLREVYYLIKFRPANLFNLNFWFIFLLTLVTPPFILRTLSDNFKTIFMSKLINPKVVIHL